MARIIVKQLGQETRNFSLTTGKFTIGRTADNDIVIANKYTSGRHCEIICDGSQHIIHDLNSRNGLFINGSKVDSKVLNDGDRVLAGGALMIFIADEDAIDLNSLASTLKKGNPGEREVAAILLGQLGKGAAAIPLREALRHDADDKVKAAAAEGLGFLGDSGAVKHLIGFFDTQVSVLRNSMVRAIIRIADGTAIPEIAAFLTHPEKKVRMLATYVLGQIKHPGAAKHLEDALYDDSFEVREAAVKALGDLGDPQSLDLLLRIATEPQRYPFMWIVDALGKVKNPRALPALLLALENSNAEVREAAANSLGRLGMKEAVPALIRLLEDSDDKIRHSAAKSLEKLRKNMEKERTLESIKSHSRETVDISAVDDSGVRSTPGQPLFGENKAAWEKWWSQYAVKGA